MAVGDVHVLARIEKLDRRAAKAARHIQKKLAIRYRQIGPKNELAFSLVDRGSLKFTTRVQLKETDVAHAFLRRLARVKAADGKRAFYVDELCGHDDAPLAPVAICKEAGGGLTLACDAVRKGEDAAARVSKSTPLLKGQDGEQSATLRRIDLKGGTFFLVERGESQGAQPALLGLDSRMFEQAQKRAMRMLGARLV